LDEVVEKLLDGDGIDATVASTELTITGFGLLSEEFGRR
jgi:hypothetical protein